MSIYINQRMINYYNSEEKDKQYGPIDIYAAFCKRLNRYSSNIDFKSSLLFRLDYIDDTIVNSIITHINTLNESVVKKYRDYLWRIFCENPMIVYESKLFHKEIAKKIFTEEELIKIKNFKLKTSIDVMDELTDAFNKPNQTISDKVVRIAKYKISVDDVEDGNLCDKLYSYLLNYYNVNNNIYAKEYLINYTAYLISKKLNIPMPSIYLSNYNLEDEEIEEDIAGISKGDSGIIILNYNLINDEELIYKIIPSLKDNKIPPIVMFMQTIIHEVRHSKQAYEMKQDENTNIAFEYTRSIIFRKYLSEKDYNEYKENYRHSEIEIDAEEYSWENICNIITSRTFKNNYYLSSMINIFEEKTCKNLLAIKKEKDQNKLQSWEYNVKKMNELVRTNHQLLNDYSQLKLIYNDDGSLKDMFELLKIENSDSDNCSKEELAKIYKDYYIYFISNGILDEINPNKLTETDQVLLFNKITDLIIDEYQRIIATMRIYDKYDEDEKDKFDFVTIDRIERINNLLIYLKINEQLILKIINGNNLKLKENLLLINERKAQLTDEYYIALFRGIMDSRVHSNIELLEEAKFNVQQSKKGRK